MHGRYYVLSKSKFLTVMPLAREPAPSFCDSQNFHAVLQCTLNGLLKGQVYVTFLLQKNNANNKNKRKLLEIING